MHREETAREGCLKKSVASFLQLEALEELEALRFDALMLSVDLLWFFSLASLYMPSIEAMTKRKMCEKIEDCEDMFSKILKKDKDNEFYTKVLHVEHAINSDASFIKSTVEKMNHDELKHLEETYYKSSSTFDRFIVSLSPCLVPLISSLEKTAQDAINAKKMIMKKVQAQYMREFSSGSQLKNSDFIKMVHDKQTELCIRKEITREVNKLKLQAQGDVEMK